MRTTGFENTLAQAAAKKLVEILLQRWPNHTKDHAQLCMYNDEITEMVEECGEGRMQATVKAARTRCHFLPEPAELRDLLPAPELFPQYHDPDCRECLGSGWKMVDVPADPRRLELYPGEATVRLAQRCHCAPPVPAARKNPTNDSPSSLEVEHAGS